MDPSFSIGTDIVEVSRVKKLTRNKRFLERIFTPSEIAYCRTKKNSAQHFAVRFAAKEAVWKALSDLGLAGIGHREVGVHRTPSGKPVVSLSGRLKPFEKRITLSLSHTSRTAVAVALFRKKS
ncbi:MAG: holo-[acyl-carrier-protein] synthase [Elusimicrobia bacterium RIFCSPLOWO2_01_FULL_64_13]|nr:MAG: holo-[acyl-carrier-protein] synthase [Elusimicrobia bacterium RIFCSPHIGHO2_01_FULL_64_10]OGR97862.1 MAG: holo-[acyl-carrier-protein] synthase [Elusimicrobia bacterium RIFCSPLOWO2_01_FULL_64_13]